MKEVIFLSGEAHPLAIGNNDRRFSVADNTLDDNATRTKLKLLITKREDSPPSRYTSDVESDGGEI
ncbi:hypothetical protein HQN60_12495 [Deefgea piscis]|uniref:Uncharacterized protein n=1 Tax=Deefgea piscis TaxID=2739061 RepID=A0A6M8T0C1_9NEIS|nr:hypothetical protein [Deefgea piscis]QKJ67457.1 hypothetical protein HQN60_12495 [Deefgea piscis]